MKTTLRQIEMLFLAERSIKLKDLISFKRIISNCIEDFLNNNKKELFRFSTMINELDWRRVPVYNDMRTYYCELIAKHYNQLHW